jgi:hypothetical protein
LINTYVSNVVTGASSTLSQGIGDVRDRCVLR